MNHVVREIRISDEKIAEHRKIQDDSRHKEYSEREEAIRKSLLPQYKKYDLLNKHHESIKNEEDRISYWRRMVDSEKKYL